MATDKNLFRVGAWTANPAALTLSDADRTVHLRPKVMELLSVFVAHPGEVLAKQELLDLVWAEVTVGDASLAVVVRELREALGDQADAPSYIETIARRGYRLIAPVTTASTDRQSPSMTGSRFWLVGRESRFALIEGANVIGRAADAEVRFPSAKVSRQHARIVVSGEIAMIEDLGSKNGTFVGGLRIADPTPLSHDDEIRLGQMAAALRVMVIGHESTITEASLSASDVVTAR